MTPEEQPTTDADEQDEQDDLDRYIEERDAREPGFRAEVERLDAGRSSSERGRTMTPEQLAEIREHCQQVHDLMRTDAGVPTELAALATDAMALLAEVERLQAASGEIAHLEYLAQLTSNENQRLEAENAALRQQLHGEDALRLEKEC